MIHIRKDNFHPKIRDQNKNLTVIGGAKWDVEILDKST